MLPAHVTPLSRKARIGVSNLFIFCHCEERSDVAISYNSNLFFLLIFFFTFLAVKR